MFNRKKLAQEVKELKAALARSEAREKALIVEREFWVEQGRSLQNQLQTWQRMYSDLYGQLGRGVVTDESIRENLALACEELRQPITSVEAVRAAFAMTLDNTQGRYTAKSARTCDANLLGAGENNALEVGDGN